MFKKIVAATALFLTVGVSVVSAKTLVPVPTPSAQLNTFELFWPMVAGKTVESKVYFLKLFKENVREALIFGKPEKADYEVFVATKRLLETESLLQENKTDLANKTSDVAISDLNKAKSNIESSKESISQDVKNSINQRKEKLEQFLIWLKTKYSSSVDKLNEVEGAVKAISL